MPIAMFLGRFKCQQKGRHEINFFVSDLNYKYKTIKIKWNEIK